MDIYFIYSLLLVCLSLTNLMQEISPCILKVEQDFSSGMERWSNDSLMQSGLEKPQLHQAKLQSTIDYKHLHKILIISLTSFKAVLNTEHDEIRELCVL